MSFCTAINCMDGRVQRPVIDFLQERFGVDYVDSITEPGPNRLLAEATDAACIDSIMARTSISVDHHGSVGIAVVGHHDCAGNPSPEATQAEQTALAVKFLRSRYSDIPVIGLWVDANWRVNEL